MANGTFVDAPQTDVTNPDRQLGGPIQPTAVVLHRTVGRWPGDLSVGTHGGRQGYVSFHFLVGQDDGEWTQFAPVNILCNHAAGANDWAFGIEISGMPDEELTAWQVNRVAAILQWARDEWGIPMEKYDGSQGRIGSWTGAIDHRHIAAPPGLAHADGVEDGDWAKICAAVGQPAPTIPSVIPTPAGNGNPILSRGSRGPGVLRLQEALSAAGVDPGPHDSVFGPLVESAVRTFQTRAKIAVDGIVGPQTWAALDSAPSSSDKPLLKEGATGPAVLELQKALSAAGFDPGPHDSIFGPLVEAAVIAFQTDRGLLVDGIVGPQTWGALPGV